MENTGIIKNAMNIERPADSKKQPKKLHIKEPGSAITHFIDRKSVVDGNTVKA